jgi:hypothetical protein
LQKKPLMINHFTSAYVTTAAWCSKLIQPITISLGRHNCICKRRRIWSVHVVGAKGFIKSDTNKRSRISQTTILLEWDRGQPLNLRRQKKFLPAGRPATLSTTGPWLHIALLSPLTHVHSVILPPSRSQNKVMTHTNCFTLPMMDCLFWTDENFILPNQTDKSAAIFLFIIHWCVFMAAARNTTYCTLRNVHYTLSTTHGTLYTKHCTLYVSFRSPYLFCLLTVSVEVIYFHLITLKHTPQSVGLLWTRDRPLAETSTWQHTTLTRDKHRCTWWESNPQSRQALCRRPTP